MQEIPKKHPQPKRFNAERQELTLKAQAPAFSFGGNVNPNTEIMPGPATFTFASDGLGKYNVLQCSQR